MRHRPLVAVGLAAGLLLFGCASEDEADGPATAPWPELAGANDPGLVATEDPVLIIHSDEDDVVPAVLSELLFARMCGLGQHVERRVLVGGGSHIVAAVPAFVQALEWFDQLLAGEEVPGTCP